MPVEQLDKRFGIVAVENKFITPEQLFEAMKIQVVEDLEGSMHRLIGEILREKGDMTTIQLDEVLEIMGIS
jgi:hypothetical protein